MVSLGQIECMISFMELHKDLALGRCSRTKEGRSLGRRLWSQCAEQLNSISSDGRTKTAENWRIFYNEYKSKILRKVKKQKAEQQATGGGPFANINLTALQERLYNVLGRDVGEPLQGVRHNPLSGQQHTIQEEDIPFAEYQDMPIYLLGTEDTQYACPPVEPEQSIISSLAYDSIVEPTVSPQAPTIHSEPIVAHVVDPISPDQSMFENMGYIYPEPATATTVGVPTVREPQQRRRNRRRTQQLHHGQNTNLEEAQRSILDHDNQSARAIFAVAESIRILATNVGQLATAINQRNGQTHQ